MDEFLLKRMTDELVAMMAYRENERNYVAIAYAARGIALWAAQCRRWAERQDAVRLDVALAKIEADWCKVVT